MSNTPIDDLEPERQTAYLTTLASSFRPIVSKWGSQGSVDAFDRALETLRNLPPPSERQGALEAVQSALMEAPDSLNDDSNLPQYYAMRCLGVVYGVVSFAHRVSNEDRDVDGTVQQVHEAVASIDDLVRDLLAETRDAAGADAERSLRAAAERAHVAAKTQLSGEGPTPWASLEAAATELGLAYANILAPIAKNRGWVQVRS